MLLKAKVISANLQNSFAVCKAGETVGWNTLKLANPTWDLIDMTNRFSQLLLMKADGRQSE